MSRKERRSEHAATAPPKDSERLVIFAPPVATEAKPPPTANFVLVSGSADLMTLELFYIPSSRFRIARAGGKAPDIEEEGGLTVIRSEPVARVSLPTSAAAELMAQMFETMMYGADDLKLAMSEVAQRIAQVTSTLNLNVAQKSTTEPVSDQSPRTEVEADE